MENKELDDFEIFDDVPGGSDDDDESESETTITDDDMPIAKSRKRKVQSQPKKKQRLSTKLTSIRENVRSLGKEPRNAPVPKTPMLLGKDVDAKKNRKKSKKIFKEKISN